jgi:hypothetical protein
MQYILVEFSNGTQAYQEICNGNLERYTDLDGNTVTPSGSSKVLNTSANPSWALPDPEPVATVTTPKQLSKYQYMNLFTDQELATIYTVAKSVIQIEVWLEKFKVAEVVDLADPSTVAGLHALEAGGLLAAGRAAEILNA